MPTDSGDSSQYPALRSCRVVIRIPIQWRDLDVYGYVNNIVYLKWFEAARTDYASRVGVDLLPRDQGVGALVTSLTWKYQRPLTYPGEVLCGVRVTRIAVGNASLECHVADAGTGVPVASGACDVVLYDYSLNQPVPVPDHIRQAVETLEGRTFPTSGA